MAKFWVQSFCKQDYIYGEMVFKGTLDEVVTHVKAELKREDFKEYDVNGANIFLLDGKNGGTKGRAWQASFRLKRGRVVKSDEIKEQYPPITRPSSYRIPDHNMAWLEDAFAKLSRKAKRLGVGSVGFEVIETQHEPQDDGTVNVWHTIKPVGEPPTLNGWRLAATLQHEDGGNIVRSVPAVEVPSKYRTVKAHCDHCNTWRGRKDTYVVLHEDGTFKQIGRNCLRDFLGGTDPHSLVNFAAWVANIDELIEEAKERGASGSYKKPVWREQLLRHVAQVVIDDGYYLGATAAREQERESTSSKALTHMFPPKPTRWNGYFSPHTITGAALELAETATAWAQGGYGKLPSEQLTDYEHNLSIVLRKPLGIDWRDVGLAASLIGAYKRHLRGQEKAERKESEAAKYKNSKHFGTIGNRETFELELIFETGFATDFGWLNIYKFADNKGNIAVWKSSKHLEVEVGDKLKVKATVKDHDLYDGVNQTVLTRCAIVEGASE